MNIDKHGWADQVPIEHGSKQIVTTVRNPFDYYASFYVFGDWINRRVEHWLSFLDHEEARNRFPGYPYISFSEFIQISFEISYRHLDLSAQALANSLQLGPMTVIMLRYLAPDYTGLMEKAIRGDIGVLKRSVARTHVLHTESLNHDTYQWLLQLGVPPAIAEPVLSKKKVQPVNTPNGVPLERGHGQPRQVHWSELFDEHTKAAVMEREWLYFELFPEYTTKLNLGC